MLNGVVFSVTLIGGGLTAVVKPSPAVTIGAGILLVVAWVYVEYSRSNAIYDFAADSKKLVEFFSHWYQRPGTHIVFCDDLDWMEGVTNASILRALEDKASAATVCVRSCSGQAFDDLRQANVTMRQIPDSVSTRSKLSINTHDGITQMLVRVKAGNNSDRIRFQKTSDEIFVGVARDLIDNALEATTSTPGP